MDLSDHRCLSAPWRASRIWLEVCIRTIQMHPADAQDDLQPTSLVIANANEPTPCLWMPLEAGWRLQTSIGLAWPLNKLMWFCYCIPWPHLGSPAFMDFGNAHGDPGTSPPWITRSQYNLAVGKSPTEFFRHWSTTSLLNWTKLNKISPLTFSHSIKGDCHHHIFKTGNFLKGICWKRRMEVWRVVNEGNR